MVGVGRGMGLRRAGQGRVGEGGLWFDVGIQVEVKIKVEVGGWGRVLYIGLVVMAISNWILKGKCRYDGSRHGVEFGRISVYLSVCNEG